MSDVQFWIVQVLAMIGGALIGVTVVTIVINRWK